MFALKKILLPVDFSEKSAGAARYAEGLASHFRSELIVLHVVQPPQFRSQAEGLFRLTTRDGQLSQVQLSNYQAKIKTNICLDDGVETKREFEIEAELPGRQFRFTIPAEGGARAP